MTTISTKEIRKFLNRIGKYSAEPTRANYLRFLHERMDKYRLLQVIEDCDFKR